MTMTIRTPIRTPTGSSPARPRQRLNLRYPAPMIRLEDAQARYEALRERDRVVASMQSKQRMLPVFSELFDEPARDAIQQRLRQALTQLRDEARSLAVELARAVFVAIELDDLGRVGTGLRRFERYLDETPAERLDVCHDLMMFLRELDEVGQSATLRVRPATGPILLD